MFAGAFYGPHFLKTMKTPSCLLSVEELETLHIFSVAQVGFAGFW